MIHKIITKIFLTNAPAIKLIIFIYVLSVLYGCSGNINPVGISDANELKQKEANIRTRDSGTLLWQNDGLSVFIQNKKLVWKELFYEPEKDGKNNLLITFDGWTNADTTPFVSQIYVQCGEQTLLMETGELYINRHHEIHADNIQNSSIRFYIALWCDDVEWEGSARLNITNLKIYSY